MIGRNLVEFHRALAYQAISKVSAPDYSSSKLVESSLLDVDCKLHQLTKKFEIIQMNMIKKQ